MNEMNPGKGVRGFTLVEVLIAMALFAFGAMSLLALQVYSMKTSAQARKLAAATDLAQYPIEAWKGTTFNKFDAVRRSIEPATSLVYETTSPCDYADASQSATDLYTLQRICVEWSGFFHSSKYSSQREESYAFSKLGKGTMKIYINRDDANHVNKYADVIVTVEWCDDKPLAECAQRNYHKVEAKQRFLNNF